jgi:hypothetical protein
MEAAQEGFGGAIGFGEVAVGAGGDEVGGGVGAAAGLGHYMIERPGFAGKWTKAVEAMALVAKKDKTAKLGRTPEFTAEAWRAPFDSLRVSQGERRLGRGEKRKGPAGGRRYVTRRARQGKPFDFLRVSQGKRR